ncbi:unnamed protein product [Brassica oleracea var. botrytis]
MEGRRDWYFRTIHTSSSSWSRNHSVTDSLLLNSFLTPSSRSIFNVTSALRRRWRFDYKKSGRCSLTAVEVRLLCFWEARNITRGDELMSAPV